MLVKCDKCSYTARYNSSVKAHQFRFHSGLKPFQCTFPECKYKCNAKRNLETHKRRHEVDIELRKPYVCKFPSCNYRTAQNCNLRSHVLAKHPYVTRTRDFRCPLCPSSFFTPECLKKHIPRHVKEKRLKCGSCAFATHDSACLQRHVNALHKKIQTFTCSLNGCNFSTPHLSTIAKHTKIHDPDPLVRRPFPCIFGGCLYRASTPGNLKTHTKTHQSSQEETEGISCSLCQKRFRQKRGLVAHINSVHAIEKNFVCKGCRFVTHSSRKFQFHSRHVHGQMGPILPCDFCDYSAVTKAQLNLHYRTVHSEEKRFKCDYPNCGFRTHHVFSLEQHLLTHEHGLERQLPFVCKFPNCDFRRRSRAEMNSHEKLHLSSQDRFKCKLCPNMSYPDRRSLDFHQCQNHSKKASKCQLCGFSFRQKRALRVHQQKCHKSSHSRVAPTKSNTVNTFHSPDNSDNPRCRNYPVNTLSPDSVRCTKECADGVPVAVQYEISTLAVVLLPRMHLTVL